MPPKKTRIPKKPTKPRRKSAKRHVEFQALGPLAFRTTAACTRSAGTTAAKRLRKTPRTDAKKCLGTVRIGQDGKYLYIAVVKRQKNPKFQTSRASGIGSHLTAKWEKVYNKRTGKPIKVSDLPVGFAAPM